MGLCTRGYVVVYPNKYLVKYVSKIISIKNPEIDNLASFWSNVQSDVPLSRKPRILYLPDIFQDRSDRNLLQFLLTDKNI